MKKKTNKHIIIEVYGGVASVIQAYKGVTVTIRDRDNNRQYRNIEGINYAGQPLR